MSSLVFPELMKLLFQAWTCDNRRVGGVPTHSPLVYL
jgi:hypothetical protein